MKSTPSPDAIAQQIEHSRTDLLDLTLRNSALHYRGSKTRGIEVIDTLPQTIYQTLIVKGNRLTFEPTGGEPSTATASAPAQAAETAPDSTQAGIRKLLTPYTPKTLSSRLSATFRMARSSIEEQGINIIYLTLGMLHWYESTSSKTVRAAPLILIPVTLARGGTGRRYSLSAGEDEVTGNLSLMAKLKESFGLSIPSLANGEDIKIEEYFDSVARAIKDRPEWTVDRKRIQIGFVSFSQLMLHNDLDASVWAGHTAPAEHPIVRRLFGDPTAGDEPASPIADDQPLDDHPDLRSIREVVDADASQTTAVLDVKAGVNLVIQGPPGTGKSQSITNLIADKVAGGRTILFVAQKRAALEVVSRRLHALGLGDACLELHSNKASKAIVLQELERTLAIDEPKIQDTSTGDMLLTIHRNRLNDYCAKMNSEIARSGVTIHDAIGRLSRLDQDKSLTWPPMSLGQDGGTDWSPQEYAERLENVQRLQSILDTMGAPADNPFHGCRLSQLTPLDLPRIAKSADAALKSAKELAAAGEDLSKTIEAEKDTRTPMDIQALTEIAEQAAAAPDLTGIQHRNTEWTARVRQIRTLVRQLKQLDEIHEQYDGLLKPAAWTADLTGALAPLRSTTRSIWGRATGTYRRAQKELSALLQQDAQDQDVDAPSVLNAIEEVQHLADNVEWTLTHQQALIRNASIEDAPERRQLREAVEWVLPLHENLVRGAADPRIHDFLDGDQERSSLLVKTEACRGRLLTLTTAYKLLEKELQFGEDRTAESMSRTPLGETIQWLELAQEQIQRLDDLVQYNKVLAKLEENGLKQIGDTAATWEDAGRRLTAAFERARLSYLLESAFAAIPELADYRGTDLMDSIRQFRENDVQQLKENRTRVARGHWRRLPRAADDRGLALVRRECAKKRRHMPLRRLMNEAGATVQQIKPVVMMSPLSLAKFVPPGSMSFDLAIIDEASQVRPTEALGTVLRAKQVVIVGDTRQLPPTDFFEALKEDDDQESTTGDLESIMGMCKAAGFAERMLRYHYRSRHESLIAVSNQEFYNNQLAIFPSPDAKRAKSGLHFRFHPDTVYEPGKGKRCNPGEAAHVAEAVMEHARNTPELSLGVAGFGLGQTRQIEDEVERRRQKSPKAESFFEQHPEEPFFVKSLECVQGDERDVILVSIGYGRTAGGTIPMRFGPLNQEGGERRLNVLITRARRRLEVYANFRAMDLDTSQNPSKGLNALKVFLGYAETGILEQPAETGREPDSPFEEAVAEALTAKGHTVRHQIGSAGFYVDLAIVDPDHPGRYLLGIECDGATYHSARTARDRDRLRQEVLEGLDWVIHRVWSTDWFMNPNQEIEAIEKAIQAARERKPAEKPRAPEKPAKAKRAPRKAKPRTRTPAPSIPYKLARVAAKTEIVEAIVQIVEVESPIHVEEATRRMVAKSGGTATRKRVTEARDAAQLAAGTNRILVKDDFLWRTDQTDTPVRRRDKAGLPAGLRKPDMMADQELRSAIGHVLGQTSGMTAEAAVKASATLFGFSRAGDKWTARLSTVLQAMQDGGEVFANEGLLSPATAVAGDDGPPE